jgi:hypothetical protein
MHDHVRFYPEQIDKILLYEMSKVAPQKIKICGIKTTPYIAVSSDINDTEFKSCIDMLKIYIKKSKELQ